MSIRNSVVLIILIGFGMLACTATEKKVAYEREQPPRVLFVCQHGSVKSLMAKLLFEQAAGNAGLMVDVQSRGTVPDDAVPEWMKSALRKDGFEIGNWRPTALATTDLQSADYVVTFDVSSISELPTETKVERWDGLPPLSQNYEAGREAIRQRVEVFMKTFEARPD